MLLVFRKRISAFKASFLVTTGFFIIFAFFHFSYAGEKTIVIDTGSVFTSPNGLEGGLIIPACGYTGESAYYPGESGYYPGESGYYPGESGYYPGESGYGPLCVANTPISWTDPTLTANVTPIRKIHFDEMRTWTNSRRAGVVLGSFLWTDPTLTANNTLIRKVHIDELRTAISAVYVACGQAAPVWTDPVLTANVTTIRKVHIDELRTAISNARRF